MIWASLYVAAAIASGLWSLFCSGMDSPRYRMISSDVWLAVYWGCLWPVFGSLFILKLIFRPIAEAAYAAGQVQRERLDAADTRN